MQPSNLSLLSSSFTSFVAAMKSDRKRLKAEKADLVNQMQQLYATLESREDQLRDFIRNYEQHRKVRQWGSDRGQSRSSACKKTRVQRQTSDSPVVSLSKQGQTREQ